MRQVFLDKGLVVLRQVCEPLLEDHSVLVRVHYSFISSGTEMATISGAQQSLFANMPQKIKKILESVATNGVEATRALVSGKLKGSVQALGYSCSGQIVAIGSKVRSLQVGDFVACAGSGAANHADIVCVSENLTAKLSSDEILKHASITTLGAIALQGIRRAQLQLGEQVCVIGLGLLGQITVQLAAQSGCKVFGVDLVPERLNLAHQLGAHHVYDARNPQFIQDIIFATQHQGADVTLITAGSKSDVLVQQAMEITRKKGRVVVVGDVGLGLQREQLYKKEIDFLISCSYGPGRYDVQYEQQGIDYPYAYVRWTEQRNMQAFVDLVERKKIVIDPLIGVEISVDHVEKAYEQLAQQKGLGAVLTYDTKWSDSAKPKISCVNTNIQFIPAIHDTLRVGVVGAGGFAKIKLMPILAKLRNIQIHAVVDPDAANALSVSRQYNARLNLSSDADLFSQDLVDAVVIASPHKYHTEQALKALERGKAVFLEKPMATTLEQYQQLYEFLEHNPQARFCVDYNRSFAPFIRKIKEAISERSTPVMIHYRMNAGFLPKDHWVQMELGAGRIIGEACHIIDLFYYLTDSRPLSISVETLGALRSDLCPTDNISAHIRFDDGSVCSLLYTALGNARMGKERMEVFFDGKSIVMDDYVQLTGYGLDRSFDQVVRTPDKGHEALIRMFFTQVQQEIFAPPIPFDRLNRVAQLTLLIDELACKGGGEKEL